MIFDIQRFSTHDGPGIRTVVFFKGCPLSCYWCENPESQSFNRELMYISRNCISCGTCLRADNGGAVHSNPAGGISIDRDVEPPSELATVCPTLALRLAGKEMSVEDIIAEVAKDKCFFATSGGGLTLSGGEPLAQIDFAIRLIEAAVEEGLDIAIESSLAVPLAHVKRAAAFPVLWLADLKHTESAAFRNATGGDVSMVLSNLQYLASIGADMVIRVPIIPGFNDDENVMRGIFQFVAELRAPRDTRRRVDLLPYHDLAIGKYASLGRSYAIQPGTRVPESQMKLFAGMGQALGFEITIGG
jgi:pyruvate formate lyase activating enzyme